jgi:hypothetical protein
MAAAAFTSTREFTPATMMMMLMIIHLLMVVVVTFHAAVAAAPAFGQTMGFAVVVAGHFLPIGDDLGCPKHHPLGTQPDKIVKLLLIIYRLKYFIRKWLIG